ncbi:MAG: anhydro-N-acetylmuramic acid kinase, partial [Neisseriaceae bacterium]|nr:anhydro-N-acetylmuramic acid kinase [Neisseriaceae bacterium]
GIANITVLTKDGKAFGFDTGPGNMLIDAWCQKHFGKPFDNNAEIAKTGKTIHPLLSKWLNTEPYFHRKPPKSTGRDLFSMAWVKKNLTGDENPADILRTLTELTARSLANAILKYAPDCEDLILCGGGAFNPLIRQRLSALLPDASVTDTSAFDLPPMQVEGAAFAWLAHCRLHKIPANLPHATGAKGERILGALWECV